MRKKEKRNLAIRVFLAARKGEKYSARQIADFLSENQIIDKHGFGGREIAGVMRKNWKSMKSIDRVQKRNIYYYYWRGE